MSACRSSLDSASQIATPDNSDNWPTPTGSTAFLGQGCAGEIELTTGNAALLISTDGSVYTDQECSAETRACSGGTIFSSTTDSSIYAGHELPARDWAGPSENYQNRAMAPIHHAFDPRTQASGRSLCYSNGSLGWETSVLPQSVPVYAVLQQVDCSGRYVNNRDIVEMGGGFSETGKPVRLDESQNCAHPLPAEDGSRPEQPSDNCGLPAGTLLSPRGPVFSRVTNFPPGHGHEFESQQGYPRVYGPPVPPVMVTRSQSKSLLRKSSLTASARKKGVRNGRLSDQQRSDTACVRKRGACFACRELKQKCDSSPGDICRPCLERRKNPKVTKWIRGCDRSPMSERYVLMLPPFIIGHLEGEVFKKYIADVCIYPLGTKVQVKWTMGYGPPLTTEMEEIYTKHGRSSAFYLNAEQGSHDYVTHNLVPLWIGEEELRKMPVLVESHIKSLVRRSLEGFPDFYHSETGGSKFQFSLLKLICRYHRTERGKKSNELTRALELLVLIFLMGESFHLTAESREELRGQIRSWEDDCEDKYPTPSIALRQLKQRLCPKLKEWMKSVLDDLHMLCRRHLKEEWAITFAVLIIFALICQDLQVSAMLGAESEEKAAERERNSHPDYHSQARKCVKDMEDDGFDVLVEFFKYGYRNLNPLEGIFSDNVKKDFDRDSIAFIEGIRNLLAVEGKRKEAATKRRDFPIHTVPSNMFSKWNSSRLVLRVLKIPYS